jgi:hypothetical protein
VTKATVFLSCGQRADEKELASQIQQLIQERFKMNCYNADVVHGFDDVMSITERLSEADYYLFIDFKREGTVPLSVFTHQEFALARAWGIDNMLAFIEEGLDPQGMLKYVLAHPVRFTRDSLVEIVAQEIEAKGWRHDYSRNLVAIKQIQVSDIIQYKDHSGVFTERAWRLSIENMRSDRAAVNAVAILHTITHCASGSDILSYDRSYLKWVGQKEGYHQIILPEERASIDAFAIHAEAPGVFLHSRHDGYPRQPVVDSTGEYIFHYRIYAQGFPMLRIPVKVTYSGPLQVNIVDTGSTAEVLIRSVGYSGSNQ